MRRISIIFIFLIIIVLNVMRFQKLESVPYGYHVDEYAGAVTLKCLATEGTNAWAIKYKVFFHQGFGTPKPPVYEYPALLWTKIFGYTVDKVRAFSVFGIILGVWGLYCLGSVLGGRMCGLFAALSATLSPWSWVLGRLGFESFLAPVFVIWALFFFFKRRGFLDEAWVGIFLSAAAYAYPPARAFVPILIGLLLMYSWFQKSFKFNWLIMFFVLLIVSIPLIMAQLRGELSYRLDEVMINSPSYLASLGKTGSIKDLLDIFINNFFKHLDFKYLFVSGDPDVSHSTTRVGLFSWFDWVGFIALIVLSVRHWVLKKVDHQQRSDFWLLILFCIVGFFVGIAPAALTFLDIPNALRMCLSWPFVCLLVGLVLGRVVDRSAVMSLPLILIAVIFAFVFLNDYFTHYAQRSKGMFSFWVTDQFKLIKTDEDWLKFLVMNHKLDYHTRYFLMNNKGQSCSESYKTWLDVDELMKKVGLK